jgi:hypothetical protein
VEHGLIVAHARRAAPSARSHAASIARRERDARRRPRLAVAGCRERMARDRCDASDRGLTS